MVRDPRQLEMFPLEELAPPTLLDWVEVGRWPNPDDWKKTKTPRNTYSAESRWPLGDQTCRLPTVPKIEMTVYRTPGPNPVIHDGCFGPSTLPGKVNKFCLTYCGDDVCDCGAATVGPLAI